MKLTHRWVITSTAVLCLLAGTFAYGKDDTEKKGMIIGRTADTMAIRSMDGTTTVVLLSDDTKVQVPEGLLRHKEMSWAKLIPGLPVAVKGQLNANGQLAASQIRFTNQSLQEASMIQAGLVPTGKEVQANQQNIATNKQNISVNQQAMAANEQATTANKEQIASNQQAVTQRFNDLADYETVGAAQVYFSTGSSTIAPSDQEALSALAAIAMGGPGYLVQVKGFADSSGTLAMNQTLSRDRAEAVIDYLMQKCNVPPRHIVAPGAMGISDPAASNETAQGKAENRRVNVTVLVNKGIADAGM